MVKGQYRRTILNGLVRAGLNAKGEYGMSGMPPFEGKVCDGTLVSGRYASIWVVPQKSFKAFVRSIRVMYREDESLFCLTKISMWRLDTMITPEQ